MTDFETKTVSLACKRCKLQVRYLLKRMKYPLPKAGEKKTLYMRPKFDLTTYSLVKVHFDKSQGKLLLNDFW